MNAATSDSGALRRVTMQALFQSSFTDQSARQIADQFVADGRIPDGRRRLFRRLLTGVIRDRESLDMELSTVALRKLEYMDILELSLLRLGLWELHNHPEALPGAIVSDCVRLAGIYGATGSYRYINAILDKLASKLRPVVEQTE